MSVFVCVLHRLKQLSAQCAFLGWSQKDRCAHRDCIYHVLLLIEACWIEKRRLNNLLYSPLLLLLLFYVLNWMRVMPDR